MTPPRVAVLWKARSGYFDACVRALAASGCEVLLISRRPQASAPFALGLDDSITQVDWDGAPDERRLRRMVREFAPEVLLVCSWDIRAYRSIARSLRGAVRVLCMDNQWRASAKQWLGIVAFALRWHRLFDVAFVPGDRQAAFARRLGFPSSRILWGLNAADVDAFTSSAPDPGARTFLFVGRLVHDKGIDVLREAYLRYRAAADDPWRLVVAGAGPLAHLLDGVEGVEQVGFVQPPELPALFSRAGCLVLPSRFEPWGVVIHEAAAAGLPVIASQECGAIERLVLPGISGLVVPTGSVDALAGALAHVAGLPADERMQMSAVAAELARQFTPRRWAAQVLRACGRSAPRARDGEAPASRRRTEP